MKAKEGGLTFQGPRRSVVLVRVISCCMLNRSSKDTLVIIDHGPVMEGAVVRIGRLEPHFQSVDPYLQAMYGRGIALACQFPFFYWLLFYKGLTL